MAHESTNSVKNLLAQSQIRTMKKDLKKLRESDVVKESQKIMASIPSQEIEKQQDFLLKKQIEEAKMQAQKLEQEKNLVATEQGRLEQQKQAITAKLQPVTHENKGRWELERKLAEADKITQAVASQKQDIERQQMEVETKISQVQIKAPAPTPVPAPPKPAHPAPTENERKRKFMEEVEAWANSNK